MDETQDNPRPGSEGAPPPPPSAPPSAAPPPPPPPPPGWSSAEYGDRLSYRLRALRRSRNDRVVAGVSGGVARGLGIDPLLLRVLVVVLTLFGGAGVVLYALGWLLLPVDDGEPSLATQLTDRGSRRGSTRTVLLALLLAVAVAFGVLSAFQRWDGPLLLSLAVVGFVVYLVRDPVPPQGVGTMSFAGAPTAAPAVGSSAGPGNPTASTGTTGSAGGGGSTAATTPIPGTGPVTATAAPPWQGPPGSPPAPAQLPPRPPAPPRERSMLGGLTLSAVLLALGALAAIDASGADLPHGAYPATALTVLGLGLLVGAWLGRARGLVWLGIVLAVVTLVASLTAPWQDRFENGQVDLDLRPTSVAELPADAEYSAGQVRYDLTGVPFEGQAGRLGAQIGFGEIVVTVPSDVDVTVHASTGVGAINLLGADGAGGFGTDRTLTDLGADGAGGGTLDLDLQAGFGHVEVRRAQA